MEMSSHFSIPLLLNKANFKLLLKTETKVTWGGSAKKKAAYL